MPAKVAPPLTLRWRIDAAAAPRTAWEGPRSAAIEGHEMKHRVRFDDVMQPVVVDQRLYYGSSVDDQVRCIDISTGRTIWRRFTDAPIRLAP